MQVEHAQDETFARLLAAHTTSDDLLGGISFANSSVGQSLRRARGELADAYTDAGFQITAQIHKQFATEFCQRQFEVCRRSGLGGAAFEARLNSLAVRDSKLSDANVR
jgi:hypothetical protein